jgi:hypothetical protein
MYLKKVISKKIGKSLFSVGILKTINNKSSARCIKTNLEGREGLIMPTWNPPVFLNVYGAQKSIPRNEFRQPM